MPLEDHLAGAVGDDLAGAGEDDSAGAREDDWESTVGVIRLAR